MFPYSDPVGGTLLHDKGALLEYRSLVHAGYKATGEIPRSGFVPLEAFDGLPANRLTRTTVSWLAFPRSVSGSPSEIDAGRFRKQDEYVEWRVAREGDGRISRIIFTTEFPEYYQALAAHSFDSLQEGIVEVTGTAPSAAELFGPGFNPAAATPLARQQQLVTFAARNPWNSGQRDILFLTHGSNTLGALFNLLGHCGVGKPQIPMGAVCDDVGQFCGAGRNSDPVVCAAAQGLRRNNQGFSLTDPAGIRILRLDGIWKLNGQQVDINNSPAWSISRGGRRAVLQVSPQLTMGDDAITSGTQVSTRLKVGAEVVSVDEDLLPEWAKTGQESTRRLTD
jgi:hypothetical protein